MPDQLGDADRTSRVAGCGLNPQLLEWALAQQATIPDAVERYPSREAQAVGAGLTVHGTGHAEHDLLAHHLDRPGEVHVPLGQLRLGLSRRPTEQSLKGAVGHRETGEIVEVPL